jgi:hypothetical protein
MLRRISLIAASVAMVALSALPAYAAPATMRSPAVTVHKLSFPGLPGVKAWGSYIKTPKFVRLSVCSEDTSRRNFAVGAVAVGYNSNWSRNANLGAVAIGYHQTVCRSGLVRYTAHMKIYTFIAGSHGKIVKRSKVKKIY